MVESAAVVDNSEELEGRVIAAIHKFKLGFTRVIFYVNWGWGPNPQSNGLMQAYWLVLMVPSPLLGQGPLTHITALPTKIHTRFEVEEAVKNSLEALREAHARVLNGQTQPSQ